MMWRMPKGFTLVEMLVVIGILLLIAGISIPVYVRMREKNFIRVAEAEVKELAARIEQYRQAKGFYPQANLVELLAEEDGATLSNTTNLGIESLVTALASEDDDGPFLPKEILTRSKKKLGNLDKDSAWKDKLNNWFFDDRELREYLDPWGNPYIYFDNTVYMDSTVHTYTVRRGNIQARPLRDDDGNYYEPAGFQLWSLGPNGENDEGKTDDITSWVVK